MLLTDFIYCARNRISCFSSSTTIAIDCELKDFDDFRNVARNVIYRGLKEEKSARTRHMHDVILSCPRMLAIRKQIFLYRKAQ